MKPNPIKSQVSAHHDELIKFELAREGAHMSPLKRTGKGGYLGKGTNSFFAYPDHDVDAPKKPFNQSAFRK